MFWLPLRITIACSCFKDSLDAHGPRCYNIMCSIPKVGVVIIDFKILGSISNFKFGVVYFILIFVVVYLILKFGVEYLILIFVVVYFILIYVVVYFILIFGYTFNFNIWGIHLILKFYILTQRRFCINCKL